MKRSPLLILFVTVFIDLLGFGLILPLLPVYIQHYGGEPWVGGMLLASFSAMQFIFSPIWGRASDRYGRRPLILMSLLGSAFSYFMFGAAPNLAALFAARVASGILTAASLPTAQAYIADVTPPEKRAGGMAMIGAAFGLGFAFGPWIGAALGRHSLALPAYFAAGLALAAFVWAFFMLPESHTERGQYGEPGADGKRAEGEGAEAGGGGHGRKGVLAVFPDLLRALRSETAGAPLMVFAIATFAFTAVESAFSWLILLRFNLKGEQATAVTGNIFGIVGVTILITQVAVMRGLARKVGEHRLVMFGTLLLAGALVGIALTQDLNTLRILSALIAVGNGVANPSLSALVTQAAGPQDRGALSGAQQGLGSLSRILAPPVNNYFVGVNTAIPFLASAVLMGAAFLLSLRLKPLRGGLPSGDAGTSAPSH